MRYGVLKNIACWALFSWSLLLWSLYFSPIPMCTLFQPVYVFAGTEEIIAIIVNFVTFTLLNSVIGFALYRLQSRHDGKVLMRVYLAILFLCFLYSTLNAALLNAIPLSRIPDAFRESLPFMYTFADLISRLLHRSAALVPLTYISLAFLNRQRHKRRSC